MSNEEIELKPEELLKAISSNLDVLFFGVPTSEAKFRFRDIRDGKAVAFLDIGSPDHGDPDVVRRPNIVRLARSRSRLRPGPRRGLDSVSMDRQPVTGVRRICLGPFGVRRRGGGSIAAVYR